MSNGVRYEMLSTEDTDDEVASVHTVESVASESSEEPAEAASATEPTTPEQSTVSPVALEQSSVAGAAQNETDAATAAAAPPAYAQLPPYDVAVDLPSYEEAERSKVEEAARAEELERERRRSLPLFSRMFPNAQNVDAQLGTDGMFLCTFMVSFVFSWLGLLASLCMTQTVAGRLGAMSGFGLSLVKWVAIIKHSAWAEHSMNDSLLWWLLILLGFLMFFRGATQYIRIKYHWHRLNPATRTNIYYYF